MRREVSPRTPATPGSGVGTAGGGQRLEDGGRRVVRALSALHVGAEAVAGGGAALVGT